MNKVYFYYEALPLQPKKALLIAFSGLDGYKVKRWDAIIDLPYAFGSYFWSLDRDSDRVIRESKEIAKEHNAPEWVTQL